MDNAQRNLLEAKIIRKLASMLMSAGYTLSVDTLEAVTKCPTSAKVVEHATSVDEAWIICEKDGRKPQVYIVLGNGTDILTDWNMSLDAIVSPVCDWAQSPAVLA